MPGGVKYKMCEVSQQREVWRAASPPNPTLPARSGGYAAGSGRQNCNAQLYCIMMTENYVPSISDKIDSLVRHKVCGHTGKVRIKGN